MASYPTKLVEAFASRALIIYYANSVSEKVTNQDYEGEIRDKGSILNVLTFGAIKSHDYTGANMGSPDQLSESNAQLITDQAKDFYFQIKSYDKFRSYIKSPEGTILAQVANELKKVVDQFVLGKYTSAQAGNRIGVPYTTGNVTVTTGTGAVVGVGTTFTAAMVGRGFLATGQTVWSRVATYTDATHITLVDDLDDTGAGAYSQGTVAGGTAFQIEANTPLQATKSSIYGLLGQIVTILDNYEIPDEERWCVIPPAIHELLRDAPEYIPSGVDQAYQDVVKKAQVKEVQGLAVWKSPRVNGDNVNGYHSMAGHRSAITFAMGLTENGIEDAYGNFGKNYKSLYVYGAKVADERRKGLTELFLYK